MHFLHTYIEASLKSLTVIKSLILLNYSILELSIKNNWPLALLVQYLQEDLFARAQSNQYMLMLKACVAGKRRHDSGLYVFRARVLDQMSFCIYRVFHNNRP